MFVPSLSFKEPPVVALLPIIKLSTALFASAVTALAAVSVPSTWSNFSTKY